MRTKTLLLTAALCAAGIATSKAQAVYSVNAVGYVNTPLVVGYNLISNPLDNKAANGNVISSLFASLPGGSQIFKFNGTGYDLAEVDLLGGGVTGPAASMTLMPGEGVFINSTEAATVTFVGEVPAGTLSNPIPAGFSIRSSQVPQAGTATALLFPAGEEDQIFLFNEATQRYTTHNYLFGAWDTEPNIEVGEAFFVNNVGGAATWNRTFSISE